MRVFWPLAARPHLHYSIFTYMIYSDITKAWLFERCFAYGSSGKMGFAVNSPRQWLHVTWMPDVRIRPMIDTFPRFTIWSHTISYICNMHLWKKYRTNTYEVHAWKHIYRIRMCLDVGGEACTCCRMMWAQLYIWSRNGSERWLTSGAPMGAPGAALWTVAPAGAAGNRRFPRVA
jgi:hypothetical protein